MCQSKVEKLAETLLNWQSICGEPQNEHAIIIGSDPRVFKTDNYFEYSDRNGTIFFCISQQLRP